MEPAMVPTSETEKALLRMADELSTRAMLAEKGNEEERAGLLVALQAITGEAKQSGLVDVMEATGRLFRACESPGCLDGQAIVEGLTKLQDAIADAFAPTKPAEEAAPVAWAADPELLSEFFVEAGDHLASIESRLLELEQDPKCREAIDAIFRGFHTIKGLAGFLEFPAMQAVAHETETLLDAVRNGTLLVNAQVIDVVLESADYLKRDLTRIQEAAAGAPLQAPADNVALIEKVRAHLGAPAGTASPASVGNGQSAPDTAQSAPENADAQARNGQARKTASVESRLVKVDTAKLDFLVDMVGELVISQSLIRHDGALNAAGSPRLQRNLSQLARITADVQKTAMSMRMVPVGQLFQKSVRIVRDLTRKSGKQAELVLEGEETELDRNIIEQLADPLMHMIRNSADHGIETPEERIAAGKSPSAKISLKAYHQSGHIVIEVQDDGRGLN